MRPNLIGAAATLCVTALTQPASGQAPPAAPPTEAPAPPPYSLPWQLRPAVPVNVVRSDLALAFYRDPATQSRGFAGVESLFVSVKLADWMAIGGRLTAIGNAAPSPASGSGSTGNPVLTALFSAKTGPVRIAPSLTLALPLGMGGGDTPDAGPDAATKAALRARSAMDNAVFQPNYLTLIAGLDVALVIGGFTAQVEATVLELLRTRGAAASPDAAVTNLTAGLHLGYFIIPQLSLGAEIRHQRFLTTPGPVKADEALPADKQLGLRDTTTFAVGPRGHFKVGSTWIRPGIAYAHGVDKPLTKAEYHIVQIDVPVAF